MQDNAYVAGKPVCLNHVCDRKIKTDDLIDAAYTRGVAGESRAGSQLARAAGCGGVRRGDVRQQRLVHAVPGGAHHADKSGEL